MSTPAPPAGFAIEVDSDRMRAELVLHGPGTDTPGPDPTAVLQALAQAGVVFGIDPAAVLGACAAGGASRTLVACGRPAVPGRDSRFELLVRDTRDRAPTVAADGLVDFRELGAIPLVVAGQALMRRHAPEPGQEGCTLGGEPVAAPAGRLLDFDLPLEGARVPAHDPDLLEAAVNGQPVRHGNSVRIEQVLRVACVDMASGNLDFDGTLQVDGDVQAGMKVHATGDILIGGGVEGAEVQARGDVRIAGGILAKASVTAGGAVSARFVEGSRVQAGTSIDIEGNALGADLQAFNAVRIGTKAPQRARLSGGVTRAMLLVQAPLLGTGAGSVTRIELGVNPDLEARHRDVLKRIEDHKAGEAKLQTLIKHLARQSDNAAMLARARTSWQHAVQTWARLLPERDALEAERERALSARLVVGAGVEGAVDLAIGPRGARLRQSFGPGTFALDGERVVFRAEDHEL